MVIITVWSVCFFPLRIYFIRQMTNQPWRSALCSHRLPVPALPGQPPPSSHHPSPWQQDALVEGRVVTPQSQPPLPLRRTSRAHDRSAHGSLFSRLTTATQSCASLYSRLTGYVYQPFSDLQSGISKIFRQKSASVLTHSERRPQHIYSQEEINLYCIIKLATEISLFSLQISKTWCFV